MSTLQFVSAMRLLVHAIAGDTEPVSVPEPVQTTPGMGEGADALIDPLNTAAVPVPVIIPVRVPLEFDGPDHVPVTLPFASC